MKIEVIWYETYFKITPDPAVVRGGTLIEWGVAYTGNPIQQLDWTIYFENGSPFPGKATFRLFTFYNTTTIGVPFASHIGIINAGSATNPGDWKYGVRLQDNLNQTVLGDDDPHLIVYS